MAKSKGTKTVSSAPRATEPFAEAYPNLTAWAEDGGWIEIGYTEMTDSFVRVLDTGGMIWEGKHTYASIDAALRAAERAVIRWREGDG